MERPHDNGKYRRCTNIPKKSRGELISGEGGGGLITGIFFCLSVDGLIKGRAYKRGGGGWGL